jgi:hypothetical protein
MGSDAELQNAPLAPIPDALLPREPKEPAAAAHPIRPSGGLSRYAEAALDNACRNIVGAPAGSQEDTLHRSPSRSVHWPAPTAFPNSSRVLP